MSDARASTLKSRQLLHKSQKNTAETIDGIFLVEVTGLEPTTSWSLTKRATKLRYTSMSLANSISYYNNYSKTVKRFFVQREKNSAKASVPVYFSTCEHTELPSMSV